MSANSPKGSEFTNPINIDKYLFLENVVQNFLPALREELPSGVIEFYILKFEKGKVVFLSEGRRIRSD